MDSSEALYILQFAREMWAKEKKDEVMDLIMEDGGLGVGVLFQSSFYQITIMVIVGPKCGLTEQCIIVDTRSKKIEADHLVAAGVKAYMMGGTTFLFLSNEVLAVKKKKNRFALTYEIKKWLALEHQKLKVSDELCASNVRDYSFRMEEQISGASLATVRFGLTGR